MVQGQLLDFSDPRFWLDAIQSAVLVLLWLRKPGNDAKEALSELKQHVRLIDERLTHMPNVNLESRVNVIEERLRHMPTTDELTELGGIVKTVIAQNSAQTQMMETMRAQLARVETFLLTHKT